MKQKKYKISAIQQGGFLRTDISSAYQNLSATVYFKKALRPSSVAFILHPGAFENAWGDGNRYKKILHWFQRHLSCHPHVITYQTSRIPILPPDISPADPTYWQQTETYWKQAFAEKKFKHELQDVREVYQHIIKYLEITEIYTLGFSLGGTLAMILTSEFPQIRKLCAIGSAISTKREYLPVLSGYPKKQWIINRITKYPHYFKIIQGTEDHIVPMNDAREIIQAMNHATQTSLDCFRDADHMFSGNNQYGLYSYRSLLHHLKHFFEFTL